MFVDITRPWLSSIGTMVPADDACKRYCCRSARRCNGQIACATHKKRAAVDERRIARSYCRSWRVTKLRRQLHLITSNLLSMSLDQLGDGQLRFPLRRRLVRSVLDVWTGHQRITELIGSVIFRVRVHILGLAFVVL